jgi:hypothetical protein
MKNMTQISFYRSGESILKKIKGMLPYFKAENKILSILHAAEPL